MTLRRAVTLLCLAVCASSLVGCGASDTLSLDPVARAADSTAKTQSSKFQFRASIDAGTLGSFSFSGDGIFDGKGKKGWMNMHFQLPPAAQTQLGTTDPSMEMIFDGSHGLVMYMRSPLFAKMVPTGKWVKMDLKKLAKKEGVDLGALMNANQADPSQSLRFLMASSGAHPLGMEKVRGVWTTHYSFTIDFKKLIHANKQLQALQMMTGSTSTPAEAWVDKQGRVRRLALTMSMGAALGAPMSMSISEELFDFGAQANVTTPSDDMVVDLSSLPGSGS
jgi:predicted small lipoprotein YifL